ncbi:MAG: ABC transporter permease [Candidatus Sumerlaeia bacterium]|nr:ABC transporter permease [Candidatus Sumerlaeia bacterium]
MRLLPFDYAVRNLGRSPRRLLGIVAGNVLVVLLIVAAAAFVDGMRGSLAQRDDSRNVILLGAGSEESIERSEISAAVPGILEASVPGIRTVQGEAFVSPEIVSALLLSSSPDREEELRAIVRGITPGAFLVHQRVEIVEGRAPRPGSGEVLAGSLAAEKMGLPSLPIGVKLWFDGEEWTVVGIMAARGSVMDAELWVPLPDLMLAMKRDSLSCVVVTLETAEFADLDAFTKMRLDLELAAIRESEYYAAVLRFYRPVQAMVWITAILVAASGVLGGISTLYAAFASRVRELGMLQALGYPRRAIAISLVQEALLAAALAIIVALLLARLFLDGLAVSYSMGVFELAVGPRVVFAGAATGLALGIIGALPPAWRCLRLPIPESLKAT